MCDVPSVPEQCSTRTIRHKSLWASDRARFAIVISVFAIYLLPFMRVLLLRTDEGTFLEGAVRILQGQLFGRDFAEVMGPGTFYWVALFFKAFGPNVLASRICLFLTWITTATVVYRLCRILDPSICLLPLTLILVTSFSSLGIGVSHHIDSNCLALLMVLCLCVWHERCHPRWLVLSGALGGLTILVHQPKGLLLLLASGIWIWYLERTHGRASRALGYFAAGVAGILGVAIAYFGARGALMDLIRAGYVWPFQHYSAINEVPYAYGTFKFNWRGVPPDAPYSLWICLLATLLIVPFLYVVVLPALLTLQITVSRGRLPAIVTLYFICGLAMWVSELHRKDIVHLVFGSPLFIILSVGLFTQSRMALSRVALLALTTSAYTLAACNLIAVLTAHTISTRVGSVSVFQGGDEVAALNAQLIPGEEIFAYPYCPSYYFLTQTANPTPFSILQSGYNTPEQVRDVIRVLESRKVKHVLWDTSFRVRSLSLVFPRALNLPDDLAPLETYLRERYRAIYDRNGFLILERRHVANVH